VKQLTVRRCDVVDSVESTSLATGSLQFAF